MINEIFQSLHEAVKKRNTPDSFIPAKGDSKDVIHRGYLTKTGVPIKYDFIPDGTFANSGTHVYNFKDRTTRALLSVIHKVKEPDRNGYETSSSISFEMMGEEPKDHPVNLYRNFVLPAFKHHIETHKPEIVTVNPGTQFAEDMMRRLGSNYDISTKKTSEGVAFVGNKKLDSKIQRILSNIRKSLNRNKGARK